MLTSGPHRGIELIDTFKATLEHRSSLRTTKKAIRSTGTVEVCRLRATRHARGIGQIEIRDQRDLFVRTRLGRGMRLPIETHAKAFRRR